MSNQSTLITDRVSAVPRWRHRIQLPDGTYTPGTQDTLAQLPKIHLPDSLIGKSVLDIGCSDGFYSFECERRGAKRVLAVDDFSSVYIDAPSGFMVARELLHSKVEFSQRDLFSLDSKEVGRFDVVLFLGVLYHLRHPLLALEKLAPLCDDLLILETTLVPQPSGLKDQAMALLTRTSSRPHMVFQEHEKAVNPDPTVWWHCTTECVEAMLRSCGFCDVQTVNADGNRGVFHARGPQHGNDAAALLGKYGHKVVGQALADVMHKSSNHQSDVLQVLKSLTVAEFGAVKQRSRELFARDWHHTQRPKAV